MATVRCKNFRNRDSGGMKWKSIPIPKRGRNWPRSSAGGIFRQGPDPQKDGRTFALIPEKSLSSPLDVPSVKAKITTKEIVDIIREGREKGGR